MPTAFDTVDLNLNPCMPLAHAHMNGKLLDGSSLWADTLVCGVVRTFSDRLDSLFLARECRDLEEETGPHDWTV